MLTAIAPQGQGNASVLSFEDSLNQLFNEFKAGESAKVIPMCPRQGYDIKPYTIREHLLNLLKATLQIENTSLQVFRNAITPNAALLSFSRNDCSLKHNLTQLSRLLPDAESIEPEMSLLFDPVTYMTNPKIRTPYGSR